MITPPPAEYQDDASRIDRNYLTGNDLTEEEIKERLRRLGFPEQSIQDISMWLTSKEDAVSDVNEYNGTAEIERDLRRNTGGTISEGRAREMARDIGQDIEGIAEDVQREAIQPDNMIEPSEHLTDSQLEELQANVRDQPVPTVRDTRGNIIAVASPSEQAGEMLSEQMGVENIPVSEMSGDSRGLAEYMTVEERNGQMDARMYGRTVGTTDL